MSEPRDPQPPQGDTLHPPRGQSRPEGSFLLVYIIWCLFFFEFHNFLPTLIGGGPVIRRIPLLLLVPLAIVAIQKGSAKAVYWPLALFVFLHAVAVPFAWNRGLAFQGFNLMVFFFVPFTAAIAVVRTPQQVQALFKMFLISFPWYCVQGIPFGLVRWHNILGNPDAFGPLGVMAVAFGYYAALGATQRKWRNIGYAIAMLGTISMVSSFARGAFLAGATVFGMIWLRSPKKLKAFGAGLAALAVLFVSAEILYPGGAFWDEMATILEGTEEQTGGSRWALWTGVGLVVWEEHPIFGVGAFNTGPVAVEIVPPGSVAGRFADPLILYNRAMHNVYVQLLAEQGLVGLSLWSIMIVGFFLRLRKLQAPRARAAWREGGGDSFDLLYISRGLEAAMAGFMVGGVFYNQVYRHWFYTLLLFSILLIQVTMIPVQERSATPIRRAREAEPSTLRA